MNRLSRAWLGIFRLAAIGTFSVAVLHQNLYSQDQLRRLQQDFNQSIKPILQQYCVDCHQGESAEAGVDFDKFQQVDQVLKGRKLWRKLEKRVLAREMPPADSEPLPEAQFKLLTAWIDTMLNSADCINPHPGRVTLRRLNRIEYQNTIRDLTGVEYLPAKDFPGDDVGYGFDNIADVLSLPPILMEKYLAAAEEITEKAIVDHDKRLFERMIAPQEFKTQGHVQVVNDHVVFFSSGIAETTLSIPQTGLYQLIVEAGGDQAGNEPVKMTVRLQGKKGIQKKVPWTREQREKIELKMRLPAGDSTIQISFDNDHYHADGPPQSRDRNLAVYLMAVAGPLDRKPPPNQIDLIGKIPETEQAQQERAKQILHSFGSRAFRRALTPQERNQLLELYQLSRAEGESFEAAMRYSLQAILVSPHFLFRVETPPAAGQVRDLNDFELATRLSYFLWSSMPDNELFRCAVQGKLSDPKILRQQVERMLADPKSKMLVENFVSQWLQLRKLEQLEPDPVRFPGVDLQLRQDMIQESQLLFSDLLSSNGSVLDLLSAEYTFINKRLAEHYGMTGIIGDNFRKVSTRELGRQGLLMHASILTVTSNPTRTSPVKRGKWIMENLLGEEPPPPDPSAMPIEDQAELTGNLRQRMEQHRADPNCAVCHKVMDQLGFALEHYDAVGRWRELDEGQPIDDSGKLPTGQEFIGAIEVQKLIRDDLRDDFIRCFTEKMLIYATGRGMEYFDECAVDKIIEELKAKGYSLRELIHLITLSEPFKKSKG